MQKTQALLVFITLFVLFLLFPLFWGGGVGRGLLPLYLSVGPLLGAAILYNDMGKASLRQIFQKKASLLSPALLLSLLGAVVFGVLSILNLLFEWLVTLPAFGTVVQVMLIGVPFILAFLLIAGALAIPLLIYFLAPTVARYGWDIRALTKSVGEKIKKPWISTFFTALIPLFCAVIILWLIYPSVSPYLLQGNTPFFAVQWFFLSPILAAFFTYPVGYFYSKATR